MKNSDTIEVKLEVFLLVEDETNVLEARKALIENLSAMDEVEKVEKVYVDKNETFKGIYNLRWNSTDIVFSTKENMMNWKDINFRKRIFSKCFLWATYEDKSGEYSRDNLMFRKEQIRCAEMRLRGYQV